MSANLLKESPRGKIIPIIVGLIIAFLVPVAGIAVIIGVLLSNKIKIYDNGVIKIERCAGLIETQSLKISELTDVQISKRLLMSVVILYTEDKKYKIGGVPHDDGEEIRDLISIQGLKRELGEN